MNHAKNLLESVGLALLLGSIVVLIMIFSTLGE